jgi:peptidoglycan/xylan/chitin deacetylase (PgdA/CDA1 family)
MLSDGEPFFPINEIGAGKKYLTFDDGYGDVVKNVYPLLKESVTPFCVFITTEFVGKQGYLSWEDVKMLSKEPLCTIGAHAKTHPLLRKCDEVKAEDEIVGSKYALESKINRSVDYFAYPYGSVYACSSRDIILAKAYKKAFSTLNGRINKSSSPWFLPRITIAGRTIDKYT